MDQHSLTDARPECALRIDFSQTGNSHRFAGNGWHGPEQRFRWCSGEVSTVEVAPPSIDFDIMLKAKLGPLLNPKLGVSSLPLRILANGECVFEGPLQGLGEIECRIPRDLIGAAGLLSVDLEHKQTVKPCDANPNSKDSRDLSFAVHHIDFKLLTDECPAFLPPPAFLERFPEVSRGMQDRLWAAPSRLEDAHFSISADRPESMLEFLVVERAEELGSNFELGAGEALTFQFPLVVPSRSLPLVYRAELELLPNTEAPVGVSVSANGETTSRALTGDALLSGAAAHDDSDRLVLRFEVPASVNGTAPRPGALSPKKVKIKSVAVGTPHSALKPGNAVESVLLDALESRMGAGDSVAAWKLFDEAYPIVARRGDFLMRAVQIARAKCRVEKDHLFLSQAYHAGQHVELDFAIAMRSWLRPYASIRILDAAISKGFSSDQYHYELGVACRQVGWLDRAQRAHSMLHDPHPHWLNTVRGVHEETRRERARCLDLLSGLRLRTLERNSSRAVDLARGLIRLGKLRGARALLSRTTIDDRHARKRLEASLIMRAEGVASAVAYMVEQNFASSSDPAALVMLAEVMQDLGRCDFSSELYRRAHELRPDPNLLARGVLASCLIGKEDRAASILGGADPAANFSSFLTETAVSAAASASGSNNFLLVEDVRPDPALADRGLNIVQFWDDPEVPEDVAECIRSWKEKNPSANHLLFSEDAARAFIQAHFSSNEVDVFDFCYHPAMKSDFARLLILYQIGGLYLDADLTCAEPVENTLLRRLFGHVNYFAFPLVPKYPHGANNDIIFVDRGNKLLAKLIEGVLGSIEAVRRSGKKESVAQVTGPGFLNQFLTRELLSRSAGKSTGCEDVELIAIPFEHRKRMLFTNNRLGYFRTKKHWSAL